MTRARGVEATQETGKVVYEEPPASMEDACQWVGNWETDPAGTAPMIWPNRGKYLKSVRLGCESDDIYLVRVRSTLPLARTGKAGDQTRNHPIVGHLSAQTVNSYLSCARATKSPAVKSFALVSALD